MAQRRMFSPDIVNSDAFLEMPPSTQALYFQLGMKADDDGFVNPKMVMRMIGSTDDELKVLIAKRFVLPFENGVIVIKHWKINNLVRKDWYKPTVYFEEKCKLYIKNNHAYTLDSTKGKPFVNEPLTQDRIGKDRIGKIREEGDKKLTSSIIRQFFKNPLRAEKIVRSFREEYPKLDVESEIKKFVEYWTEPEVDSGMPRWEGQRYFDLIKRLKTWFHLAGQYEQQGKPEIISFIKNGDNISKR